MEERVFLGMTLPKIVLLPLDVRPCCYEFPRKLAMMSGANVVLPSADLLNPDFMDQSDHDELWNWLRCECLDASYAVISIDMLAFGGLAASRRPLISAGEALARVSDLGILKRANPKLTVMASSAIMPLQPVVYDPSTARQAALVARYFQLAGHASGEAREVENSELMDVAAQIAPAVLEDCVELRGRNHLVNRAAVEAVAGGVVDFLLLPQCDSSRHGPHIQEQASLVALARSNSVLGKIIIYPGTDEAGMVLLARSLVNAASLKFRVFIRYGSQSGAIATAPFEDMPICDALRFQIAACGGVSVDSPDRADLVMFANTPPASSIEHDYLSFVDGSEAESRFIYRRSWDVPQVFDAACVIQGYLDDGRAVGVADVSIPNGADPDFMECLASQVRLADLASFAAWNTAGNTIGTVLAHGCARHVAQACSMGGPELDIRHYEFLFERYVDDWLYQSLVRTEVEDYLAHNLGVSPLNLGDRKSEVDSMIRDSLSPLARNLFRQHFGGVTMGGPGSRATYVLNEIVKEHIRLPWKRTFEVSVDYTFGIVDEPRS
jgi:hypothetical protein